MTRRAPDVLESRWESDGRQSARSSGSSDTAATVAHPPSVTRTRVVVVDSLNDSEVYGFVVWLSSLVLGVVYLLWALVPDETLHRLGITYYPDKWWSVSLPAYFLMLLLFVPIVYLCWNMYNTEPLDSMSCMVDGWTHQQQRDLRLQQAAADDDAEQQQHTETGDTAAVHSKTSDEYSIEEIVDIPLERINQLMYQRRR